MPLLTVQTIDRDGLTPVLVAADVGGDKFVNTGKEFINVLNGSGAPITVTLDIRNTVDAQVVTDRAISVPAGGTKFIGPIPPTIYNDANGEVDITYSAVGSLTIGIVKLP